MAVFSLYATKMIAAGQGGMLCTDDEYVAKLAGDLRHYDKKETFKVRYNYTLPDFSAALACSQLERLDELSSKRRRIARFYNEKLKAGACVLPPVPEEWNAYRYIIETDKPFPQIRDFFREQGIEVAKPVFRPLHRYLHLPPEALRFARKTSIPPISPAPANVNTHQDRLSKPTAPSSPRKIFARAIGLAPSSLSHRRRVR